METDVWRQTTKHNHAQFMMQSTDPLSTPLRFMSCNSQSSCNFFLTKKDRSRSSCQHSFINMHERIFILAMRAGATVMLEAMNIQIWKQTTITLHMRIFGTTTVVCYHTYWCIHASFSREKNNNSRTRNDEKRRECALLQNTLWKCLVLHVLLKRALNMSPLKMIHENKSCLSVGGISKCTILIL